jgi:hypothetical protein
VFKVFRIEVFYYITDYAVVKPLVEFFGVRIPGLLEGLIPVLRATTRPLMLLRLRIPNDPSIGHEFSPPRLYEDGEIKRD